MFFIQKSFKSNRFPLAFLYNQNCRNLSWLSKLQHAHPIPIFEILNEYIKDKEGNKVNLVTGTYRDENGKPIVLKCVRLAEEIICRNNLSKDYFMVPGSPKLRKAIAEFVLGRDSEFIEPGRHTAAQVISATGGLSMAAQFLMKFYPGKKLIYLPNPTEDYHKLIFSYWGLKVKPYCYLNPKKLCLDFNGLIKSICGMEEKSIILLQANAHSPTGLDPTVDQWKEIAKTVKERNLYGIILNADQGFASGSFEKDACGIRIMANECINMIIVTSFSRTLALYSEPVGTATFLVDSKKEAKLIDSHMVTLIRGNYGNPPICGSRIVEQILTEEKLKAVWCEELKEMVNCLNCRRKKLVKGLCKAGSTKNWDFIKKQVGMYAYTGLNCCQIERLQKQYHIYTPPDGRMSLGRMNCKNMKYICKCLHKVTCE